jgi:endogenous inhibitor of DNA gyrase (YacG/DUF329 family)
MTGTTRACVTCATPITVTTRNPNRRFCSPRCRVADWHARNDPPRRPHNDVPNDVPNVVPNDVNDVPKTVPDVPQPGNTAPASGSVTRCPRCQTPLTVLTWLLPPAAAHVAIPPAPRHD